MGARVSHRDTVYDRPHGASAHDPLAKVPLFGGSAHAAVAQARAAATATQESEQ